MVIDKIINNNIVSAFDEKGLEVVIMGRGIGFQMKRGQEVPAEKIEKVFRIKSQSIAEQLKELLAKMPLELFCYALTLNTENLLYLLRRNFLSPLHLESDSAPHDNNF